jgi:hypothetical protein
VVCEKKLCFGHMASGPTQTEESVRSFANVEQIVALCSLVEKQSLTVPLKAFGLLSGEILTPLAQITRETGQTVYVVTSLQLQTDVQFVIKEFEIQYTHTDSGYVQTVIVE